MEAFAEAMEGDASIVEDRRTAGQLGWWGTGSGGERVGVGIDIGSLAEYAEKWV
jgi:hypothetical protein